MPTTQLTCPYCGSTLTFGQEVAAGAFVPCLICNQTFAAQQPVYVPDPIPVATPPPPPAPAAPKSAASDGVLQSIPVAPPPVRKPAPKPAVVPKAPAPRRAAAAGGGRPWLGAAALAVVLLCMLGGLFFVFWKNVLAESREDGDLPVGPALVLGSGKPKAPPAEAKGDAAPQPPAPKDDEAGEEFVEPEPAPDKVKPLVTKRVTRNDAKLDLGGLPVLNVKTPAPTVPGVTPERVDDAIARGIRYLRGRQQPQTGIVGTNAFHPVGVTALAGLTLLECNVPADDPAVQRAAAYVRSQVTPLTMTYELSLAILFLDRLGQPQDRPIIQGLAMRLISGQGATGGWSYNCDLLSPQEMQQLYLFLQARRPEGTPPPKAVKQPPAPLPKQAQAAGPDPFHKLDELLTAKAAPAKEGDAPAEREPTVSKPPEQAPPKPAAKPPGQARTPFQPVPPQQLPLPPLNRQRMLHQGDGDNSNTQFALLALWAARRHDVPTESALVLAQRRFQTTQNGDGGWGYHLRNGSTPAMTCVGLLGLAMGHGALSGTPADGKATQQDPAIQKGLAALGRSLGTPAKDANAQPQLPGLYFLWSVERVAMLYDLKTIGGKDWYGWGAQGLLAHQQGDGNWNLGQYPGSGPEVDTCFALLFLRRSNLVQDLTENLRLFMAIRDPDAGR